MIWLRLLLDKMMAWMLVGCHILDILIVISGTIVIISGILFALLLNQRV